MYVYNQRHKLYHNCVYENPNRSDILNYVESKSPRGVICEARFYLRSADGTCYSRYITPVLGISQVCEKSTNALKEFRGIYLCSLKTEMTVIGINITPWNMDGILTLLPVDETYVDFSIIKRKGNRVLVRKPPEVVCYFEKINSFKRREGT